MSDDQRRAQLVRENQRLRQALYECQKMLRGIFVRNLIEDSVNPVHTSNLSSQLEKNGIRLPWADLMICTLEVIGLGSTDAQKSRHPSSHEEFNHMRDTVLLVCEGMLNVRHICYSADAGSEILLLLSFQQPQGHQMTDQEMVQEIAGIMSQAVDYLENSYSILIAAAVSQPTRSLRDLTRIWQESRALFEETGAYTRSRVLTSYDITVEGSGERYRTYNDRLFYNAVLTGDFPQARALTDAYIETFAQSDNALWELKPLLKKRLRTAASLFPAGRGQNDFQVGPEIDSQVSRCKTVEQLETLLDRFFQSMEPVTAAPEKRTDPIRRYIQENFADRELGIELLCRKFGYSPSYLSHLYKVEQGENLVDEITRIRVQTAKRLLSATNDTVTAIAEQVGYNSAWTLTRAFRRQDGISPTQYRRDIAGTSGK